MYLKICILVILAVANMAIDFNEPSLKSIAIECMRKHGIKDSVIEKLQKGQIEQSDQTKDFKCFIKCVNEKLGLVNEKGEPLPEVATKYYNIQDEDLGVYKTCLTETIETDPCEKSYRVQMCVISRNK